MPSKEKVLVSLNKNTYTKQEVQYLINSISHVQSDLKVIKQPSRLKRGDIFWMETGGGIGGLKPRPIVIIKVLNDKVLGIPLTKTKNSFCLCESRTRFGGDGYFTTQVVSANISYALNNFASVYDNEKLLRKTCRELKTYFENNIKW